MNAPRSIRCESCGVWVISRTCCTRCGLFAGNTPTNRVRPAGRFERAWPTIAAALIVVTVLYFGWQVVR